MDKFAKKILTLRQLLIGARYYNALSAMEFAAKYHTGTRKDGTTPEFDHQISIALHALTLPDLVYREEVISTIFLHDCREDYGVTDAEIRSLFNKKKFAKRVALAVDHMTKEFRGVKRDEEELFATMATDPIASIAKGCDRIHNISSMNTVFSKEKQKEYIDEVEHLFLPMIKKARRNFPHQVMAYENIKFTLLSQISFVKLLIL